MTTLGASGGGGNEEPPPHGRHESIELSARADDIRLRRPSLKEFVATRILGLFSWSLLGTLAFAGVLVLIDALFIFCKIIVPSERLMTERIIMTFITATVVQVGAAIAAIVVAVFRTGSGFDD